MTLPAFAAERGARSYRSISVTVARRALSSKPAGRPPTAAAAVDQ